MRSHRTGMRVDGDTLRKGLAEEEGFEPPGPFGPTVFKTDYALCRINGLYCIYMIYHTFS